MQAALRDLDLAHHESRSFIICQRVLLKCHEIIFGDLPPPAITPYAAINLPFQARFARRKIKHHAEPVFVGIGVLLAGVPALPQLTDIMGEVAIEQGRIDDGGNEYKTVQMQDDDVAHGVRRSQSSRATIDVGNDDDDTDHSSSEEGSGQKIQKHDPTKPSVPPVPRRNPLARRRTVGPAQTTPALPLHLRTPRRPRLSDDPLGQLDYEPITTPYQSSPSISAGRPPPRSGSFNIAESLLQKYDFPSQVHLLRSHYCRSEVCLIFSTHCSNLTLHQVQFLLSLENISNRLLVVPRPARVSALRAELTALNHKLPAEVHISKI